MFEEHSLRTLLQKKEILSDSFSVKYNSSRKLHWTQVLVLLKKPVSFAFTRMRFGEQEHFAQHAWLLLFVGRKY